LCVIAALSLWLLRRRGRPMIRTVQPA